jgi:hypothetical protein
LGFVKHGSVTGVGPSQLTTQGLGSKLGGAGAGVTVVHVIVPVIE